MHWKLRRAPRSDPGKGDFGSKRVRQMASERACNYKIDCKQAKQPWTAVVHFLPLGTAPRCLAADIGTATCRPAQA